MFLLGSGDKKMFSRRFLEPKLGVALFKNIKAIGCKTGFWFVRCVETNVILMVAGLQSGTKLVILGVLGVFNC